MNFFKPETASQKPYIVVAVGSEKTTLMRGENRADVPNNGYQIGEAVLFDGNTVITQPAEIITINI